MFTAEKKTNKQTWAFDEKVAELTTDQQSFNSGQTVLFSKENKTRYCV